MNKGCKKSAFTLAEVLITLVIIGIVAALTVPTIMTNYQKKETVTHLKKIFSVMEQALNNSVVDNGAIETWDFTLSDADFLNKYLMKYLSVNDRICNFPHYSGCAMPSKNYLDKSSAGYNGSDCFRAYVYLNSGEQLGMTNYSASHDPTPGKQIIIDINGEKNPNVWGKDVFLFAIRSKKQHFVPYGPYGSFNTQRNYLMDSGNSRTCSKDTRGWYSGSYCAALIIRDGWEIKDDYPW